MDTRKAIVSKLDWWTIEGFFKLSSRIEWHFIPNDSRNSDETSSFHPEEQQYFSHNHF